MYLKSIEVHGFKSFANKIVFDFHQGITGIVGPNGSGKSNVADAVRWVLGEQSARQLRGASMQDVIFAGTEGRKPVSYAYVAITLDNADHVLPVDYGEVTVARRVYRSGESEYLMNGTVCRLRDVYELFYDTGIGKEGYSIIGQGQIEQILSGKPEERRELFDEAAGIVKFKRRKAAAGKKLEHERENMVRIRDILSELERQVAPLERQAEKAKDYIKKKETLKSCEVNLFLLDMEAAGEQLKDLEQKCEITDSQLLDTLRQLEGIREEYDGLEQGVERLEEEITGIRDRISHSAVRKGKLEGEINVLKEQIHTAGMSLEHYKNRMEAIEKDKEQRLLDRQSYETQKTELDGRLAEIVQRREDAGKRLQEIRAEISRCNGLIEGGKNEIIELLNHKGSVRGKQQRLDMMLEQSNIQKARLNQRKIRRKSEETDLETVLEKHRQQLRAAEETIRALEEKEKEYTAASADLKQKLDQATASLEQTTGAFHKTRSRLEALRNIAERYDGYGGSIRRVMEQKAKESGIHGVVADLIKVEKKYETAIETALGGSIQNIVTEDEATAKKMVQYLKVNKYGRATFLPLTSVTGRSQNQNARALACEGVIGMANTLVQTEPVYEGIMSWLLGRVIVVDQIDHAVSLARDFHYSLHIVTLEGEHLSPGGSISGGAFRNSSNLLGRKREMEELQAQAERLGTQRDQLQEEILRIRESGAHISREQEQAREDRQAAVVEQNTARMNLERVQEQKDESEKVIENLRAETRELDRQQTQIAKDQELVAKELKQLEQREREITRESEAAGATLEYQTAQEERASGELSQIQLEEANLGQQAGFIRENLERTDQELQKLEDEVKQLRNGEKEAQNEIQQKEQAIAGIQKEIEASAGSNSVLEDELAAKLEKKEAMSAKQKHFFQKREELAQQQGVLDKELFRLGSQKEKLEETRESRTNYMWTEYELTPHNAAAYRTENGMEPSAIRTLIAATKDEIRALGDVNVNAIEEYKEVSERFEFLKGQYEDLTEAEKTLVGIIEELDTGMRRQFAEKFTEIQREFDQAFKELFGGGKGTLELVEDEDILECGIRIIAHPPGKKLQNMMQLSGGEKALTAIALLFAIQNLKPSPFCLLDEIEAALDDSNVTRFAKYLHKLTKHTQFIVITHRRGTMTASDRLYGITMQEKGISALVSVSLIESGLN